VVHVHVSSAICGILWCRRVVTLASNRVFVYHRKKESLLTIVLSFVFYSLGFRIIVGGIKGCSRLSFIVINGS